MRKYEHSHPDRPRHIPSYGKAGSGNVPYPKPQMDWVEIRRAKLYCENGCEYGLGYWTGECPYKLLPNVTCFRYKKEG